MSRSPYRSLGVTQLESRDLMSASPLPVLLVVADGQDFYFREYNDTRIALESQGVPVVVGAATTNPSTPHWNTGQPTGTAGTVVPDVALADVDPDDYSAIAFVGGWGASMYQYAYNDPDFDGVNDNYYVNPRYNADANLNDGVIAPQKVAANQLIGEFLAADKPVAAICHGVTVLAWARVDGVSPLAGRQVAVPHLEGTPDQWYDGAWRNGGYLHGQAAQVIDNGGIPTAFSGAYGNPGPADDVIADGNIITAENPLSATNFGLRIAQQVLVALPPANTTPTVTAAAWAVPEGAAAGTVVGGVVAADPDSGQSLTYAIEAGNEGGAFAIDPSTGVVTVADPAALDFEATPTFQLTVRVTDSGPGKLSGTAVITVRLADVLEPGVRVVGGDLVVTGTAGADTVYLWSGAAAEQVGVWMNGTAYGSFTVPAGGRVVVTAGGGNDQVFATDLRVGATLRGDAGHDLLVGGSAGDVLDGGAGVDRLWGSAGDDLIRGGAGDDFLYGREGNDVLLGEGGNDRLEGDVGRDILVGGLGADVAFGGAGDDVLIGGATGFDGDDAGLGVLQAVWLSADPLDARIAALTASGLGGPAVVDDGASDSLIGGAGGDWMFAPVGDAFWMDEDDHEAAS